MKTNERIIVLAAFYLMSLLCIQIAKADSSQLPDIATSSAIRLDHAISGSIVVPSHSPEASTPKGVGISHSLINSLPAGNYYAVVFFDGLGGCPTNNYAINSYIPDQIWAEDILGPSGMYSHAWSSSGGGCMQQFFVNPDRGSPWLWGALDPTSYSTQIADLNGIPAFAICATAEACDPISPHADLSASTTNTNTDLSGSSTKGISSVLFLPGIKASSLYESNPVCITNIIPCDIPLWLPISDITASDLYLTNNGKSIHNVYTKESDILSHAYGQHFYDSFSEKMQEYAASSTSGTGWSWKAIAYDWRLSLPDIINGGTSLRDRLYFEENAEIPYIENQLRQLASSSPTGKVTIIAHSNGGLVAKALLQKIGDMETSRLVDSIVFVGVPQGGAPRAVTSLLYGEGESLPGLDSLPDSMLSASHARTFAYNSPMAYHLLPTAPYIDSIQHTDKPLISFGGGELLAPERLAFGDSINNSINLYKYLRGEEGRIIPSDSDLSSPSVLNSTLLQYATQEHAAIDTWVPPAGVPLYQIAGSGIDTISGIKQYEQKELTLLGSKVHVAYQPTFEEDGDGIVPLASANMLSSSQNSTQYIVNLATASSANIQYDHSTLLAVPEVLQRIDTILHTKNVSTTEPEVPIFAPREETKKVLVLLHSSAPTTLTLTDSIQSTSKVNANGSSSHNIHGSSSGKIGEVSYILLPSATYSLHIESASSTTADLDFVEMKNDAEIATSTIAGIPLTGNTSANIESFESISSTSPLIIQSPSGASSSTSQEISVVPISGETVFVPLSTTSPNIPSIPSPTLSLPQTTSPVTGSAQPSSIPTSNSAVNQQSKIIVIRSGSISSKPAVSSTPQLTTHTTVSKRKVVTLKRKVAPKTQKVKPKKTIVVPTRKKVVPVSTKKSLLTKKTQPLPIKILKIQSTKSPKGPAKK